MGAATPCWQPEAFARRLPALQARARIKQAIRRYFFERGIVEVETPALQRSPGNETHISAFRTEAIDGDGHSVPLYLHSSPEFACKKLLAAGLPSLFTLAPVFRNRERGRLHHPEFWMLEWYRAGASLDVLMEDCVGLLRVAADILPREAGEGDHPKDGGGGDRRFHAGHWRAGQGADLSREELRQPPPPPSAVPLPRCTGEDTHGAVEPFVPSHRSVTADPFAEPEILPVVDAFRRHAGIDLAAMLPDAPDGFARLADAAQNLSQRVAPDDTWSDLFSKILSAKVEPNLGHGRPTFLTRYPASEAALARLCSDDQRFAERFELYCCGVELANAFDELTDAAEQRRRFETAETERRRIYGETYPLDEDFLAALPHMPQAVGIALGFDRLVMLATGAERIEDVLWASVAEADP